MNLKEKALLTDTDMGALFLGSRTSTLITLGLVDDNGITTKGQKMIDKLKLYA